MFKLVRCPNNESLELVEYVDTPLGMLIHRCSKFRPVCAMTCARMCAAVLDRRAMEQRVHHKPIEVREGQLELACRPGCDCELEGES